MGQIKVRNKFSFLLISFIFLILSNLSYSTKTTNINYLKIPFKTKIISLPKDDNQTYNEYSFLHDFLENYYFLDISIGSPPQNITILVNPTNGEFSFNQGDNHLNFLLDSLNNKYYFTPKPYNIEKSTSSQNLTETSIGYYIAEDIFYFNSTTKTKIKFSYDSYLNYTTDVYGTIGLNLDMFYKYSNSKFIRQIIDNGIINKYLFSFVYTNKYNKLNNNPGFLYIGPELHYYNPENYKYYQYIKTYFQCVNKTGENKLLDWEIKFDAIQYAIKKNTNEGTKYILKEMTNKTVILNINSNLIKGTKEYYDLIDEIFFKEYLNLGLCTKNIIQYKYIKYYVYSCDKDLLYSTTNYADMMPYSVSFSNIPELHLKNVNLQYNFTFGFTDLFYEIGKKYYFKIIFEVEYNHTYWEIGKIFLEKYQIIIDVNAKTFGIYNPDLKYREPEEKPGEPEHEKVDEDDKKIWFTILKFVIIIIIILTVGGLSIFVGMKIKEPRKKRVNELLDDDFDYESKDVNNNDKNEEFIINEKNAINE